MLLDAFEPLPTPAYIEAKASVLDPPSIERKLRIRHDGERCARSCSWLTGAETAVWCCQLWNCGLNPNGDAPKRTMHCIRAVAMMDPNLTGDMRKS